MSNRKRVRPGGTAHPLRNELVSFPHPVTGDPVVAVLPAIPDTAPAAIKEGIARRRLSLTTGACPCGATFTPPVDPEPGSVIREAVLHEDDCPAITTTLVAAIRRWLR